MKVGIFKAFKRHYALLPSFNLLYNNLLYNNVLNILYNHKNNCFHQNIFLVVKALTTLILQFVIKSMKLSELHYNVTRNSFLNRDTFGCKMFSLKACQTMNSIYSWVDWAKNLKINKPIFLIY